MTVSGFGRRISNADSTVCLHFSAARCRRSGVINSPRESSCRVLAALHNRPVTALTILIRTSCFRLLALVLLTATSLAVATPPTVFSPSLNKVVVNDVYKAPK